MGHGFKAVPGRTHVLGGSAFELDDHVALPNCDGGFSSWLICWANVGQAEPGGGQAGFEDLAGLVVLACGYQLLA
jgi:hypothetical protein